MIGVRQISIDGQPAFKELQNSGRLFWDSDFYSPYYATELANTWYHSPGPYNAWDRWECLLIYVNIFRGTVVFEIEYEMFNASLRYGDSSELYISLFSGDEIRYLDSVKAQILFPNDKMPRDGNYEVFTLGTNSHTFPFSKSTTLNPGYTTFHFELDESQLSFRPYNRYIEFALISFGDDKHSFTQFASHNDYFNTPVLAELLYEWEYYINLAERYNNIKIILLVVFIAITVLILTIIYLVDKWIKKKYELSKPTQEIDLYREIPSDLDTNFAGALVFCKHQISDEVPGGYAAVMMSLVRKGYIDIDKIHDALDWNTNNVRIILKHKPQPEADEQPAPLSIDLKPPLTQTEEQYFNLIVRHIHGDNLPLSRFQAKIGQDFDNTNSFVRNTKGAIKSIGVSQGYFIKANYKDLKKSTQSWALALGIIGVVIMITANLIAYQTRLDLAFGAFFIFGGGLISGGILLEIFSRKYVLLTQFGEDEYTKWRGLYNFLKSETLIKERTVLDVAIWEDYLIYGTAFGISKKVIKALDVRFPDANMSPVLCNQYFRTRGFYHISSRSFRGATRTASHASRTASFSSRSGSWGGGYGGGGRGGGGGGGGH